jgi:PAS domain S-box-containing protein
LISGIDVNNPEGKPGKGSPDIWELRIYVAGKTPRSLAALSNLKRICEQHLKTRYRLQVIDLLEAPELASADQIIAIPTVLRNLPLPQKKIAGDLSNTEGVLLGLEVPSSRAEADDVLRAISTGEVDAFVQSHDNAGQIVALQGSEEPYRLLVESMNEGALTVAGDGSILYCNSRFARMVNTTREQIVGLRFQDYIAVEDEARFAALLVQGLENSSRSEFILKLRDGSNLAVQLSFHVETSYQVPAAALLVSDISELKRTAEALEQSRREELRIKDEFLSHVSHELRSPLTAISLFVSILNNEFSGPLNPQQKDDVQTIARNVSQLNTMIDDLLEMTRAETGKLTVDLQWASVDAAIAEVVESAYPKAGEKNLLLKTDLSPGLPLIYADPARLRQILTNLVQNALKFTRAGQVAVRARIFEDDHNFVVIEVEDTGCGLQADAVEKIFERLYQIPSPSEAGRKGLGIGLFICRELVKRQGGNIWVKSEPSRGSCFRFTLPVASLSGLIAPLIGLLPSKKSLALLTVSARCGANDGQPPPRRLWHEIRQVVQNCTLPELDVLLPDSRAKENEGRCFVAALADQVGAEVLASRLREQLRRWEQTQQTGMTFSVSYQFLNLPATEPCGTDLLQIISSQLKELLKEQSVRESGARERSDGE